MSGTGASQDGQRSMGESLAQRNVTARWGAGSSADNPELSLWNEFMQSGDQSTPETTPPPVSAPASDAAPPPSTPATPAPAAETSFLHGLLRRAASTIESARREVATSDVLQGASQSLHAAFAPGPPGSAELASESPRARVLKTSPMRALRVTSLMGAAPVHMFALEAQLAVVTEHTVELFSPQGARVAQVNLADTRGPSAPNGTPSAPQNAVCATYIELVRQLVVAHADHTVHVYSMHPDRFGHHLHGVAHRSTNPICIANAPPGAVPRVLIGGANGMCTLTKVADLADIAWLTAPPACETQLGVGCTAPPVTCVAPIDRDTAKVEGTVNGNTKYQSMSSANLVAGYDSGCVSVASFDDPASAVSYAAHAGRVSGVVTFFRGALVVSIGGEEDRSLCVCTANTGRCLVRRVLPYIPTCLDRVHPSPHHANVEPAYRHLCASEYAFLVGGAHGEVDVFHLVPLSAEKVEVRLVLRVADRSRAPAPVLRILYLHQTRTLCAMCRTADVRRWELAEHDAHTLTTPHNVLQRSAYDAQVATAFIARYEDEPQNPVDTRLALGEGVIAAQHILAVLQDDDTGLDDVGKDQVVEAFQKAQAEMQQLAENADATLRRAKLRVVRAFKDAARDMPDGASPDASAVLDAARHAAAAQLNTAALSHADTLANIRSDTVHKLRLVLLNALDDANGDPGAVNELRAAANQLAEIPNDQT